MLALPQAYTLSVLGPQGLSRTKLCGYFSLGHHPETWPTSLRFGLHPSFRQMRESVENIYTVAGEEGMLKVIMWSKIYDHRSGSLNFWEKTRDAAYEKLNGQSYIVNVVLDGDAKKIFNQLCAIPGLGRYRKPVLEGYETYFSMNEASDFKWLSGGWKEVVQALSPIDPSRELTQRYLSLVRGTFSTAVEIISLL